MKLFFPGLTGTRHGVEDPQQLVGAGSQGNFFGFAGSEQPEDASCQLGCGVPCLHSFTTAVPPESCR